MQNIQVSAFTAALRSAFWQAWQETADVAENDPFTTVLPSTTLIEHYPNWGPAPAMQEWDGSNDYGTIASYIYSLQNKIYRASLLFKSIDWDDDQTGALAAKPKELAAKAKKLVSREVMKALGAGTTGTFAADGTVYGPGFDGTNFFATSHNFGVGSNLLSTYNTAAYNNGAGDTTPYQVIGLYHGDKTATLKPMVWQQRKGPEFNTTMGEVQADESMQIRCWATIRGRAGYGIWFNAVRQPILGLPNQAEMHSIFQLIENAFRSFQLPKQRSTSFGEYVFEQTRFNAGSLCMAGSANLSEVLRQALEGDWAAQNVGQTGGSNNTVATTNRYKGFASYLVSNYL